MRYSGRNLWRVLKRAFSLARYLNMKLVWMAGRFWSVLTTTRVVTISGARRVLADFEEGRKFGENRHWRPHIGGL